MTADAVAVVVRGTGSIGTRHLDVLASLRNVRAAAFPVRADRRRELEAAGHRVVDTFAEAARSGAKLAIIATDTGRHADDAVAAMDHGLDVLIEKPLATDAAEARRVIATARERGRALFVACPLRFSEGLALVRRQLARLGRLHGVTIECRSYLPDWRPARPYRECYSTRADEGGVLRDLIHEIDYAGWLFGWPTALHARVRNLRRLGIAADEAAELTWETRDRVHVSVSLDYLSRPPRRRLAVFGERGTVEWDAVADEVTAAVAGETAERTVVTQTRNAMLAAQTRAFVAHRTAPRDERLATGEDAVRALAVCDAARRAEDSRRLEKVDDL